MKLGFTRGADTFPLELAHTGVGTAERADVGHLAEHDVSCFNRYEKLVTLVDVEHPTCLSRDDYPPEIVDFSDDT